MLDFACSVALKKWHCLFVHGDLKEMHMMCMLTWAAVIQVVVWVVYQTEGWWFNFHILQSASIRILG